MVQFSAKKLYDPEQGKFVREIKSNDIFHLATNGAVSGSAGTILATTTSSTNKVLFLTAFVVGAKQNSSVYVVADSSTILPTNLAAHGSVEVTGDIDAPLCKIDCTTAVTISIYATDAGTYTAYLSGVYHPIFDKVETA